MSNRPWLAPVSVITSGNMAANITSSPTILKQLYSPSYQVTWSGSTPVGTVSVQMSNDYSLYPDGTVKNSGTWTTIYINVAGSPSLTAAVTGNTGSGFIDLTATSAYAVRLIYTATSGTGTLQALMHAKVS